MPNMEFQFEFSGLQVSTELNYDKVYSIDGRSIKEVKIVGGYSDSNGARNTYQIFDDDGKVIGSFTIKNGDQYTITETDVRNIADRAFKLYEENLKQIRQETQGYRNEAFTFKENAKTSEGNAQHWAEEAQRLGNIEVGKAAEQVGLAKDEVERAKDQVGLAEEEVEKAKSYAEEAETQADKAKRYYTPVVDDEGNLTWTPSRTDMPSIDAGNVYGDAVQKMMQDISDLQTNDGTKFGYAEYSTEDNLIHFYDSEYGNEIGSVGPIVGGAGSGGGGSASSTISARPVNFSSAKTVAGGEDCILTFEWSSTDQNGPTGDGSLTVVVEGTTVISDREVVQGTISVNLKDYLKANYTNTVRMTLRDVYGNSRIFVTKVKTINVSFTTDFDETRFYSDAIEFSCIPVGDCQKEIHVSVDGVELPSKSTIANGRSVSYVIPQQPHGVHDIKIWLVAIIEGTQLSLAPSEYKVICTEEGNGATLIAVRFDGSSVKQYYTSNIRYQVYSKKLEPTVTLTDGTVATEVKIGQSEESWPVRKDEVGDYTLSISCDDVEEQINLHVVDSGLNIHPATDRLEVYLSSKGHIKGDDIAWAYGDVVCQFEGDFNKTNDGWQVDEDGIPVMRLIGNDRMTIPVTPFNKYLGTNGKTIEVEFSTSKVFDYDTTILSCMDGGRGIEATAQAVTLHSSENTLYTQYKEDEHVRVSFVISRASNDRIVYCYINGILSGAYQYSTTEGFEQTNPQQITIGSSDCVVDIYSIRIYDTDITRFEVVDNWLIDKQNGAELLEQYEVNQIYLNDNVTPEKLLAIGLPVLVIEGSLPMTKTDSKKVSGYFRDPEDSSRSFDFNNATIKVQGTSSVNYPRKNYKISFDGGFKMDSGYTAAAYTINDGMPSKVFTFKADFASSEGANNVELVRLYNDTCVYQTPAQAEDPRVRQGIDGFPIAIFNSRGLDVDFIGKYNFNYDKASHDVFGFVPNDESWEITGNGSDTQLFKSADFNTYDEIKDDFEARYPESDISIDQLKAMMTWVASTDTTVAGLTEAQKTERLQKFRDEFEDWFDLDDAIFYYLFTEMFLMVDSRAKNAFPTIYYVEGQDGNEGKWCWLPYDMDTAIGIDNGGRLMFSYNLEDTDYIGGNTVYNGQNSVLWSNLRDCFQDEIKAMYARIRSNEEFSWDKIEERFKAHQSKWPVALWNEDAYYKYILPLINDGEDRLYMCQGSKEEQRKWWLFNRFRYMDSKYNAMDALAQNINFRANANNAGDHSEFNITPYADIYACVSYDGTIFKERAARGQETMLEVRKAGTPTDLVVAIYSADQLKSIGDISGFMPDQVDISKAKNLQYLKVGDSDPTYENTRLTSLTLGNNVLLRTVDARNCINLSGSVDASKCDSIEEAYFDNTSITSLILANGSPIRKLHLPDSVSALVMRNLANLSEFVLGDSSNVRTMWVEYPSDAIASSVFDVVRNLPADARIRAIGLKFEVDSEDDIDEFFSSLDTLKGLDMNGEPTEDKAQVSGIARIDTIAKSSKDIYEENYPNLRIEANHVMCRVVFMSEDGTTLLHSMDVEHGHDAVFTTQYTKESTAQYHFQFVGWSREPNSGGVYDVNALKDITDDTVVYCAFAPELRSYTVTFTNDDNSVLATYIVPYGDIPVYTGQTPVTTDTSGDYGDFKKWDNEIVSVTGDAVYKAVYVSLASQTRRLLMGGLKEASSELVTKVRSRAFNYQPDLLSADFPNAISIGDYAFFNNAKLEIINFPNAITVGSNAFAYSKIKKLELAKAKTLNANAFMNCKELDEVWLPDVESIGTDCFSNCTSIKIMYIGTNSEKIATLANKLYNVTPEKIYVPANLFQQYKSATNWSYYEDKILPYGDVEQCVNLTITADDVSGRAVKTKITYTAECTYSIEGEMQDGTITISDTVYSEEFGMNQSYDTPIRREISFTYLGVTAHTTITQGVYVDSEIKLTTDGITAYGWELAPDDYQIEGYSCYRSTNYKIPSSTAVMKIKLIGYDEFDLYIRSYGESRYDYTCASPLNAEPYSSNPVATTSGNQNSDNTFAGYTKVSYTDIEDNDYIYVYYRKDGSGDIGDDRGYVLIPKTEV